MRAVRARAVVRLVPEARDPVVADGKQLRLGHARVGAGAALGGGKVGLCACRDGVEFTVVGGRDDKGDIVGVGGGEVDVRVVWGPSEEGLEFGVSEGGGEDGVVQAECGDDGFGVACFGEVVRFASGWLRGWGLGGCCRSDGH